MNNTSRPLDLSALETDYQIVGELNIRGGARAFIATRQDPSTKRRDDHSRVLITVLGTPDGDEGNALSHFAADSQLLARLGHRRLIPVIEGRWVNPDAFAIVTQRTNDPVLSALLARSERFSNPRIAAILRDVNGLLEWAREQRIIHRTITADTLYLEPQTDRVAASFLVAPIPMRPRPEVEADACTIARLAVAMLTGTDEPLSLTGDSLAEARPDLPEQVLTLTATLLSDKPGAAAANIPAYLALIGLADPIAAGESELERVHVELLEEQRTEREKLAAERAQFERTMADERAHFERTMADERGRFVTERADYLRAVEKERAALAARRDALEQEAAARIAELERVAALDRESIATLREQIRAAGESEVEKKRAAALEDIDDASADIASVLDREELAAPPFVLPPMTPLAELMFDDDRTWMTPDEEIAAATRADALSDRDTEQMDELPVTREPHRNTSRTAVLVGIGMLGIAGIAAVALSTRAPSRADPHPVAAAASVASTQTVVAPPAPAVPLPPPGAVADSLIGTRVQPLDSATALAQVKRPRRKVVADSSDLLNGPMKSDSAAVERARRDSVRKPDTTSVQRR